MPRRHPPAILRFALWTLACSLPLSAHDLAIQTTLAPPAVVARALYGASEPVAFAKVTIHAPGAISSVYQSGNADAQGYFCFRPSSPGDWRITADDELGHVQQATIHIPGPFTATAQPPAAASSSRLERAALGLALIVGLAGFWYGFRARRA
ncbi:MAG TPA: hypothetical protein PKJ41_17610 [Bryobacteraceae bacterium]|nr:hypothetical protein [Bryobacteraceae bacterium]HPT28718.1 hypothetical protein [Bryobacteraceae bacterium]